MITDEDRQGLHERLDRILDQSVSFGGWSRPVTLSDTIIQAGALTDLSPEHRWLARDLMSDVVALAQDIVGHTVITVGMPRSYEDGCQQRRLLREWLLILFPLIDASCVLPQDGERHLTAFEVVDALSALDAGEVQPIFAANKGKNRRPNRWSLARTKLQALVWKKRLCALGYGEKAANHEITIAFGEQWDTVRKWKTQCDEILGKNHVYAALIMAGSPNDHFVQKHNGMFGSTTADPMDSLRLAGRLYRKEMIRSVELSRRKVRSSDEKAAFASG